MEDNRPKVPCMICGDPTPMIVTKLCDGCWALDRQFDHLNLYHPDKARAWLEARLLELDERSEPT